ncbi:MAG: hypothetical protein OEL89_00315 [Candidatus Peregrinibacteria bacterium]|nr:hypothetical protein [Candidatus Peregrinibacteria bacterium]
MTLQEINKLLIENFWHQLTFRLLPDLISVEFIDNAYDGIIIDSEFAKPSLLEYEAEFVILKQELIDAENARLAEIERVNAIKARFSEIESDIHNLKMGTQYYNEPNPAIILKDIIDSNDSASLDLMEAEYARLIPIKANKEAREIQKRPGKQRKLACEECLDIIRGGNLGKTQAEIDGMKTMFADIYTRLVDGSPEFARVEIEAIPNDGIIDLLKKDLLDELTEHGF